VPHVPLHWRHLRGHSVALLGLTVAKEQNPLHTQKKSALEYNNNFMIKWKNSYLV
jgi:hypothetical protein